MNTRSFLGVSSSLFLLWASLSYSSSSSSQEHENEVVLDHSNFQDAIKSGPHFVMFFAPWCGHCKRLHPTWSDLANKYNVEREARFITIAKVDCTVETSLCTEQGIKGYPTLTLFNGGPSDEEGLRYRGRRDLNAFDEFLAEQVKDADAEDAVPSKGAAKEDEDDDAPEVDRKPGVESETLDVEDGLAKLTETTFDAHVGSGVHFVKFFAPWCGHCQRMAGAWDQLAKTYEDDDQISIGRVDCTSERGLCERHGVRGYPTLLAFVDGKLEDRYQGGREFQSLYAYVKEVGSRFEHARLGDVGGDDDDVVRQVPAEEPKIEAKSSSVTDLTEVDFNDAVKSGLAFVKFFAPWCGHCQRLAPDWEELANKLSSQGVIIGKVDCTVNRELCSRFSVSGYPTILLLKDGIQIEEYEGGRSLADLEEFVRQRQPRDEL